MSGKSWIAHSNDIYIMIHGAQESKNENEPLVMAITRNKNTKGWPVHPKETPYYKNDWTHSDFFEKPYDWREQESGYNIPMNNYKVEKAVYDALSERNKLPRSLRSKLK
jgi:hypothetical protein